MNVSEPSNVFRHSVSTIIKMNLSYHSHEDELYPRGTRDFSRDLNDEMVLSLGRIKEPLDTWGVVIKAPLVSVSTF